ncbi:hypothetical protein ACLBOM_21885 [Escherichia coli]
MVIEVRSYGQQSNGRLRWRRRWLVDLMRDQWESFGYGSLMWNPALDLPSRAPVHWLDGIARFACA